MILQNAIGYETDIQSLLEKSLLNMDKHQIKTWMKYQFDASSMFCFIEDNKIISCLQVKRRNFSYQKQMCSASLYTMAATHPDYRQRGYFNSLLDAAINQSVNNDLITLVYTTFPKLFENRSFLSVSKTLRYWIPARNCTKGNDKNIKMYSSQMDLYPAYQQFISHFDGNIIYTKEEFDHQLEYSIASNKKIVVMTKEDEIKGFAVYKTTNKYISVDTLVYLDSASVYDLFKYLSLRAPAISFIVTEYEKFSRLFQMDYPTVYGSVIARCNNYKLFSNWSQTDVHNARQIFEQLEKPSWNHFID